MAEFRFGQALPDLDSCRLHSDEARALLAACHLHADYTVRELREIRYDDGRVADGIVVDVDNRQVPARSPVEINVREPLILIHNPERKVPYEARALREDFPLLLHQNAVREGEPVSLCLYEQPWATTARTWTPSRFLQRILWWLGESAQAKLHASGQPLEQLFYAGRAHLILPADFETTWTAHRTPMCLTRIRTDEQDTYRPAPAQGDLSEAIIGLIVRLAPVGHPALLRQPASLGELIDYFAAQGSDLITPLSQALRDHCPTRGMDLLSKQTTLLIVCVPRVDTAGLSRVDTLAAFLGIDPGNLGLALGVFDSTPGSRQIFRSYSDDLGGHPQVSPTTWRPIPIEVAQTSDALSPALARGYGGFATEICDFPGVLGGLGALGSALFDLWTRSGWGRWTLIDPDTIAPHNLARHVAVDEDIGFPKAHACARRAAAIFPAEPAVASVNLGIEATHIAVTAPLDAAALVVDATTSLGAARELSLRSYKARTASVFFTPSAGASVLLLEDVERNIRLFDLEAQYYRAVLNQSWGEGHLAVTRTIRPGATCRDVSFVLSPELVQIHAATIGRQLRLATGTAAAQIGIWIHDVVSGALAHEVVEVAEAFSATVGVWSVGWDRDIENQLSHLRGLALPSETGGVLVGIIDTALRRIQVVDVWAAPEDSLGSPSGFVRGTEGLLGRVNDAASRTHGAVQYVGDWHSHPPGHGTEPSPTDLAQLIRLSTHLAAEDLPALIAIVGGGDGEVSWTLASGSVCE